MPHTINGIGTWYYGKSRIHRRNGVCAACQNVGELQSYDTTLFFVVLFVPLIPISRKRVLEECPHCRKHRVIGLKQWEASKESDLTVLMEKLSANPDDPAAIQAGIGLAASYQDEALFDKMVETLAGHRRDDAVIQAQLGGAYGYFSRWTEAEDAYRASLAAHDDPEVRRSLAVALLKQGRPQEAEPYLAHILDEKLAEHAGMIYLLVQGYQAQGQHQEALDVMDRRDEAFPEAAQSKDLKAQRKTSTRYRTSGKKVRSAFLNESGQAGYREGGKGRLPWLIGPLVAAILVGWYLYAAVNGGNARRIFLVNGRDKPYAVTVNGQDHNLPAALATAVEVPEGEVHLEFRDPRMKADPVSVQIETPFFSRPFLNRTFIINPDQLAVLLLEETEYSAAHPANPPPVLRAGQLLYAVDGLDYQFAEFPQSMTVKKGQTVRKSRVALVPLHGAEDRIGVVTEVLEPAQRIEYGKRWLAQEPQDVVFLSWVLNNLPAAEVVPFVTPRLADRPIRVEWHMAYQSRLEKDEPKKDLRPEYRKLVEETHGQPDALYLLGRLLDLDEADKAYRKAAAASPPSVHALHGLGWRELAQGHFAEAVSQLGKALKLAPGNALIRRDYESALLANKDYDRLLADLASGGAGPDLFLLLGQLRIYAVKGDRAKAREVMQRLRQSLQRPENAAMRPYLETGAEMILCLNANDVAGYLAQAAKMPNQPPFEPALLQGKLDEAAASVQDPNEHKTRVRRCLLYLAARKAGNAALADQQWSLLLADLAKSGRYDRQLGDMLAGPTLLNESLLLRLPLDPDEKRVLLLIAAQRYPNNAKALRELAQKLDFQHDVTSLCLQNVR